MIFLKSNRIKNKMTTKTIFFLEISQKKTDSLTQKKVVERCSFFWSTLKSKKNPRFANVSKEKNQGLRMFQRKKSKVCEWFKRQNSRFANDSKKEQKDKTFTLTLNTNKKKQLELNCTRTKRTKKGFICTKSFFIFAQRQEKNFEIWKGFFSENWMPFFVFIFFFFWI